VKDFEWFSRALLDGCEKSRFRTLISPLRVTVPTTLARGVRIRRRRRRRSSSSSSSSSSSVVVIVVVIVVVVVVVVVAVVVVVVLVVAAAAAVVVVIIIIIILAFPEKPVPLIPNRTRYTVVSLKQSITYYKPRIKSPVDIRNEMRFM